MGAGASTQYTSVEAALADGKTQEEVDAYLAAMPQPFAWCFGYGSIVDSHAEKGKFVEINVKMRRVWNTWNTYARGTFLGLMPADTKGLINGIVTPIYSQEELDILDIREQGYSRIAIPFADVTILNDGLNDEMKSMKLTEETEIFTYMPDNHENRPCASFPILQTYVDMVVKGFLKFTSDEMKKDESKRCGPTTIFLETTLGWSNYMLNDRAVARRPWIFEKSFILIDDFLDDDIKGNDIPAALYPEEYAAVYGEELREALRLKHGDLETHRDRKLYNADKKASQPGELI